MHLRKIDPSLDGDITTAIESFDKGKIAELLVKHANANAIVKTFRRNLDLPSSEEKHLLHLALELGDIDIVQLLLKHGANPFLKNSQGKTAAQVAISHNPAAVILIDDHWKLSPTTLGEALWFALHEHPHRWEKQIEILLERGADPNFSREHTSHQDSHKGKTSCLSLAISHASPELIKKMLEHGAADEKSISSLKKKKKEAFDQILENIKKSSDFETQKQANIVKRNTKEAEACPEDKAIVSENKRIEQEAENARKAAEEERTTAILKRRAAVEAIEREAAEQAQQILYQKQYAAFEKIYTALREGQTSWVKTNFLSALQNLTFDEKINAIKEHAKDASSRTAKAWELAQAHCDKANSQNLDLFDSVYNWSFSHSGFFKRSRVTGTTFFRSREFQLFDGEINAAVERDPNSRTAKIVRALG